MTEHDKEQLRLFCHHMIAWHDKKMQLFPADVLNLLVGLDILTEWDVNYVKTLDKKVVEPTLPKSYISL